MGRRAGMHLGQGTRPRPLASSADEVKAAQEEKSRLPSMPEL